MSKRYLDQLALALKVSSLMRSMRGRGGGYQLARPAEQISVGEIIEAAIGPINVVECVRCPEICLKSDYCECRWVYERINDEIVKVLNGMSLAELADMNRGQAASGVREHRLSCNPGLRREQVARCETARTWQKQARRIE